MENAQTYKLIMLPTEKETLLCLNRGTKKIDSNTNGIHNSFEKFHHLYILDEEEIVVGDWVFEYTKNNNPLSIFKCTEEDLINLNTGIDSIWKKILATTDKELSLPLIQDSFVFAFILQFNNNVIIEEVKLKISTYYDFNIGDKLEVNKDLYGLKKGDFITVKNFRHHGLNDLLEFEEDKKNNTGIHVGHLIYSVFESISLNENNEVTIILPEEKFYTKEELKSHAYSAVVYAFKLENDGAMEVTKADIDKFLEQALK